MAAMSVVYSLYDALVSINVPDDKAKAVIDAMEREMMDKLATKADLIHVRELLSRDIQALSDRTEASIKGLAEKTEASIRGLAEKTGASIKGLAEKTEASIKGLATNTDTKIQGLATKAELTEFARKLTVQTYLAVGGCAVFTCSVLGTLILLR